MRVPAFWEFHLVHRQNRRIRLKLSFIQTQKPLYGVSCHFSTKRLNFFIFFKFVHFQNRRIRQKIVTYSHLKVVYAVSCHFSTKRINFSVLSSYLPYHLKTGPAFWDFKFVHFQNRRIRQKIFTYSHLKAVKFY